VCFEVLADDFGEGLRVGGIEDALGLGCPTLLDWIDAVEQLQSGGARALTRQLQRDGVNRPQSKIVLAAGALVAHQKGSGAGG
jgi:hypothetical protein